MGNTSNMNMAGILNIENINCISTIEILSSKDQYFNDQKAEYRFVHLVYNTEKYSNTGTYYTNIALATIIKSSTRGGLRGPYTFFCH